MTNEETINYFERSYASGDTDDERQHNEALDKAIKVLEQQPCEDWYDVPSDEMTLEQARQAVKDLRKKLAEYLEQQPSEDCISRQAVLDNAYAYGNGLEPEGYCVNVEDIQALPPVIPQPFINKPCVSEGVCREDKMQVLDKIRAEIAEYGSICVTYVITDKTKTDEGIDELLTGVLLQAKRQVLDIIDKYRAESEE